MSAPAVKLLNPEREPLMRREKGEICQRCSEVWGVERVIDPMYGCPNCDAPGPGDFSSNSAAMREMLGIGGK